MSNEQTLDSSTRARSGWTVCAFIFALGYSLTLALIHKNCNYYCLNNDYWGVCWLAYVADIGNPESLPNGFHPIGWPCLLNIVARPAAFDETAMRMTASWINAGFTGLTLFACFLTGRARTDSGAWGFMVMAAMAVNYNIFQSAFMQTPEAGCVAFVSLSLYYFQKSWLQTNNYRAAFLAGVFIGLAGLWRYYGVSLAIALSLAQLYVVLIEKKAIRPLIIFVAGAALVISPQILVNVLGGRGVFATHTAYNILVYHSGSDFNWYQQPAPCSVTLKNVLQEIPAITLLRSISSRFASQAPMLLGLLALNLLMASQEASRRYLTIQLGAYCLAMAVQSLAGSPRGIIVFAPIMSVEIIVLIRFVLLQSMNRTKGRDASGLMLLLMLLLAIGFILFYFARDSSRLLKSMKEENQKYEAIDRVLRNEGVSQSGQVFAVDFFLYLPKTGLPVGNGSWVRYDGYRYNEFRPELPVKTVDEFYKACQSRGITHLILSKGHSKSLGNVMVDIAEGKTSGFFEILPQPNEDQGEWPTIVRVKQQK